MIDVNHYLDRLGAYCQSQGFAGYDPYDGLNSQILRYIPLGCCKLSRQAWTQFFKNSPFNLRKVFLIDKGYNPKGLVLFVLSLLKIYKKSNDDEYKTQAKKLLALLERLSLNGYPGYCWGYNFPWQSRAFYAPKDTPNAICTVFCTDAFVNAYEVLGEESYLEIAKASLNFFLKSLNITGSAEEACFSYTPLDYTQVHNINFWIAYILCRLNSYVKNQDLDKLTLKAVKFSINRQNKDGSWYYGTALNQRWIDNFHTAYNLMALKKYIDLTGHNEFLQTLTRGYGYFDLNFSNKNGMPGYFAKGKYPIDIHAVATSIITYNILKELDPQAQVKAENILSWAIQNLWDKKGYFYFQKHKFYTNRIPYMRWAQAWMFYAITHLLE